MKRISISSSFKRTLVATTCTLCTTLYSWTATAQSPTQHVAPTTITSKHKVKIIIDRERGPNQTFLLLKIMVPDDATVESFSLTNPSRIVVDFIGVKVKTSENVDPPVNDVVKVIRLGAHSDKLRVVLDLSTATVPQYEWRGGARQATLRILESGAPAAPLPATPAAPQPSPAVQPEVPTQVAKVAPTAPATQTPVPQPTQVPTRAPELTPTRQPTNPPTPQATSTPPPPPTSTFTVAPTAPPVQQGDSATKTEPKLPDMTDKDLEDALDKEVARATEALERGEELPETLEFEGEDLVDVPMEDVEDLDLEEEPEPARAAQGGESNKAASIITKDLPTGTNSQAPAKADGVAKTDSVTGLRANPVPAAPVTEFTVQSAEYTHLEPDHKEAFKVMLSRPGAQAQMSKVDPTTYKIVISKCGLANLGLALPQYPPADFKGILAVTPKVEGDTVEITAQVDQGVSLTTLMRDRELWIKRQ